LETGAKSTVRAGFPALFVVSGQRCCQQTLSGPKFILPFYSGLLLLQKIDIIGTNQEPVEFAGKELHLEAIPSSRNAVIPAAHAAAGACCKW
jgi:hypothetical protein